MTKNLPPLPSRFSQRTLSFESVCQGARQTSSATACFERQFGTQVRRRRHDAGLLQMALAHIADLDPTYISAIEQGRRNVSLVNIHVLARALGISPAILLNEEAGGK
jgi:ribosome-binding protein aMBF1 (putative translation factor)